MKQGPDHHARLHIPAEYVEEYAVKNELDSTRIFHSPSTEMLPRKITIPVLGLLPGAAPETPVALVARKEKKHKRMKEKMGFGFSHLCTIIWNKGAGCEFHLDDHQSFVSWTFWHALYVYV